MITHGRPLWLGERDWNRALRGYLEVCRTALACLWEVAYPQLKRHALPPLLAVVGPVAPLIRARGGHTERHPCGRVRLRAAVIPFTWAAATPITVGHAGLVPPPPTHV